MVIVNVHATKMHFSQLLEGVAQGKDVVIAKANRPLARLVREYQLEIRFDLIRSHLPHRIWSQPAFRPRRRRLFGIEGKSLVKEKLR